MILTYIQDKTIKDDETRERFNENRAKMYIIETSIYLIIILAIIMI